MENSSTPIPEKKSNRTLIAYRISPKLLPIFEDLAQQAFDAKLIQKPSIISLSRFSLNFFAEMWLQQKIAQSRHREQP